MCHLEKTVADEGVLLAANDVVAVAAIERVVAGVADEHVVAVAAVKRVVAPDGDGSLSPSPPRIAVGGIEGADQHVIAVTAGDLEALDLREGEMRGAGSPLV